MRRVAFVLAAFAFVACAQVKQKPTNSDGGGGNGGASSSGAGGRSTGTGGANAGATGAGGMVLPGADAAPCTPSVTCNPPGGQYCGTVGNGCIGGMIECPPCTGGDVCEFGLCVGSSTCVARSCGNNCGTIGNGCGRALECPACPAGQQCSGGICVDPGCVPGTCNGAANSRFCGTIGDGCGGTLDCGTCPSNGVCGTATSGVANVCSDPNCVPITCTPMGGQYCGTIGNNCGGTLSCGACANGMACPTSGPSMGICPGSTVNVPPTCTGATKTTISGTVYDPAGKNPLYNVIVYIPSAPLDPIPEGVSCDRCGAQVSGRPIATALTDTNGRFSLQVEPVPSTSQVPLVMQIGKWRRQITIPTIQTCRDNPITDINQTRMPRTRMEGNIPRIAVTTGGSDALECLIRRIGIADTEFATDGGAGRVHLYAGGDGTNSFMAGGNFAAATALWSNASKLATYDVVVLSCEGSTSKFVAMKPQTSIDNVAAYANRGGRLFLSHLHFYWLQMKRPDFSGTATYAGVLDPPGDGVNLTINQTFPKGMALAQWLAGPIVAASPTPGQIMVNGSEHSVTGVNAPTTEWIYLPNNPSNGMRSSQYLSFNTPVGTPEAMQCGKAVFTDIHIKATVGSTGGDDSDVSKPFPMGCKTNNMSPQAKALEFLFFDLSSCLQPDTSIPVPPIVPPPGTPTTPPPTVGRPPAVPPPPPPPPPPIVQ